MSNGLVLVAIVANYISHKIISQEKSKSYLKIAAYMDEARGNYMIQVYNHVSLLLSVNPGVLSLRDFVSPCVF